MTAALVRACVFALREHPQFNAIWTEDGLLQADDVNVGIAIALDDGLVAPALLTVDRLDARETAAALSDLAERARAQRLRPAELGEATFTLSNLGMFGVTAFTAIVTPPQVAILATARPVERWLFVERRAAGGLRADGDAERRPSGGRRRRRGAFSGDVQAGDGRPGNASCGARRQGGDDVTSQENWERRQRPGGLAADDAGDPALRGQGAGALHAG